MRLNSSYVKLLVLVLITSISVGIFSFASMKPSHDRVWQEEFAVMPEVTFSGDVVEIKHIRDWRYTPAGPYQKNYLDRQFNVKDLEKVWFLMEPFSGWDGVAHTYFVFDFKNQEPVSFSIEARRDGNEQFDFIAGLMNKFEVMYLWGTEKDFTANRVVTFKNEVYMFPLQISSESGQKLFLELAQKTAYLYQHPRFYNTLTSNCTSALADHANNVKPGTIPFHYARFLPGYSAPLLYDLGFLDNSMTYEQLHEKYRITQIVKDNYEKDNFSELLRTELAEYYSVH